MAPFSCRRPYLGRFVVVKRRRSEPVAGAGGQLLCCLSGGVMRIGVVWTVSLRRCAPGVWASRSLSGVRSEARDGGRSGNRFQQKSDHPSWLVVAGAMRGVAHAW